MLTLARLKWYNINMRKIIKRVFLYFGVASMSLFATVVLCAGFLFFYRDGNIFGFQYVSIKETIHAKTDKNMSATEKIEVNGNNFEIKVRASGDVKELSGSMVCNVSGYTRTSKSKASFTIDYNSGERKVVFTAIEPTGWLSKKNSYILIMIPTEMAKKNCQICIKSNKADITLGGGETLSVGEVVIRSGKGDFIATNVKFNENITLDVGKGDFAIDEGCISSKLIDVHLSVGSGRVGLMRLNEKFEIDRCVVDKITRGEIYLLKAVELYSAGDVKGGGKIVVGQVGSVNFASEDTDISIDEIANKVQSNIRISGMGDVKISTCRGDLKVDGCDGNIVLENSYGATVLTAKQGDISLPSATLYVSASTDYGNINITFGSGAGEYSSADTNASRKVFANTLNGHITVKGLQNGRISASGKGRIDLEYDKVLGVNEIIGGNGNINIVVPSGRPFNLTVLKTEVNCDIMVGVVNKSSAVAEGGWTENGIYGSSMNDLKVQSGKGVIKIRSKDLI